MQRDHRIVIVDRLINHQTVRSLLPLQDRRGEVPLRPFPTKFPTTPKKEIESVTLTPIEGPNRAKRGNKEEGSYGSEEEAASPWFAMRSELGFREKGIDGDEEGEKCEETPKSEGILTFI